MKNYWLELNQSKNKLLKVNFTRLVLNPTTISVTGTKVECCPTSRKLLLYLESDVASSFLVKDSVYQMDIYFESGNALEKLLVIPVSYNWDIDNNIHIYEFEW